jgi:hypothetical protein
MNNTKQLDRKFRWFTVKLKGPDSKSLVPYTFRGLTQGELVAAGTKPDKDSAEDYILKTCVVDWNAENQLSGTTLFLLEKIKNISGLDDEGKPFNEAVDWMTSDDGKFEALAIALIPNCSPEVLRNCDPSDRAKYLLIGKVQYETMYGRPVGEAFGALAPQQVATQQPMNNPIPGVGEKAIWTEDSFSWSK